MKETIVIFCCHAEGGDMYGDSEHWGHTRFFEVAKKISFPLTICLNRNRSLSKCYSIDEPYIKDLKERGHEIGLHVHPSTLIFSEEKQKKVLDRELKFFRKHFGFSPTCFAAAHFCLDHRTINCLEELGFTVDLSVIPNNILVSSRGVFANYWGTPFQPYFPSKTSISRRGKERKIVEIPLTVDRRNFASLDISDLRLKEAAGLLRSWRGFGGNRLFIHTYFHSYSIVDRKKPGRLTINGKKVLSFKKFITRNFKKPHFVTAAEAATLFKER